MPQLRVVLFVAALGAAACGAPAGPDRAPAQFALRALGAQPIPAVLSHTAGGRLIEVAGGALTFESLAGRGGVGGYVDIRVTDPGAAPRVERRETAGHSVRRGDALEVTYASGARETFAVAAGGAALRTTAASCAPTTPCLGILHVYQYEREAAEPTTP